MENFFESDTVIFVIIMSKIIATGTFMSIVGFLLLASTKAHANLNQDNERLLNTLRCVEIISVIFIAYGYANVFTEFKTLFENINTFKFYTTIFAYSIWTFILWLLSITFEECLQ